MLIALAIYWTLALIFTVVYGYLIIKIKSAFQPIEIFILKVIAWPIFFGLAIYIWAYQPYKEWDKT